MSPMLQSQDPLKNVDSASPRVRYNKVPVMSPRIWNGMLPHDLGKLMRENRYRIDKVRWPMATIAFAATAVPAVSIPLQRWLYAERARQRPWVADPIFVVGHWRSGTTLLHEYLTVDDQFASPTTFQCFNPLSFLVTESWLKPATAFLLPKQRPMDNMQMGWDVPQEDEFALMTMGLPTTYRRIAFPNGIPRHMDYLNMKGIPFLELQRWKQGLQQFLLYLNYKYGRQLVLKSPPHTGRMSLLREMYPDARFVHITRHPLKFIPSTMHMWGALDWSNGFQLPTNASLQDYVFKCFDRLYEGYWRDCPQVPADSLITIRYEDFVRQPLDTLRQIYGQLRLQGFERVREQFVHKIKKDSDYRPNQHPVTDELRDEITAHCRRYCEAFGYAEG